jgi:hypothetical protein
MLLVAAAMLLAGTPARAQIVNQFVNGSFEDNYAGWTFVEDPAVDPCFGAWGIATTGFTLSPGGLVFDFHNGLDCPQNSPGLPITFTATDGNQLAFHLQDGRGKVFDRMYQDIAVGPGSTLHWDMQYRNHAGLFDTASQYLAVRIRDVSDVILEDLFITDSVTPQLIPMTPFSADLSAYAGRTVRLSVDIQAALGFLDAQFDNFRLAPNNTCTPPSIASVTATPSVIWPPNHKKVLVTVTVDATAVCGPPVCKIVAITRDERSKGWGDAARERDDDNNNARRDARIVGPLTAEIRAERAGGSHGRTYTITVECTDTAGNATRKDTQVFVPHDRRKHDRREDDRRD